MVPILSFTMIQRAVSSHFPSSRGQVRILSKVCLSRMSYGKSRFGITRRTSTWAAPSPLRVSTPPYQFSHRPGPIPQGTQTRFRTFSHPSRSQRFNFKTRPPLLSSTTVSVPPPSSLFQPFNLTVLASEPIRYDATELISSLPVTTTDAGHVASGPADLNTFSSFLDGGIPRMRSTVTRPHLTQMDGSTWCHVMIPLVDRTGKDSWYSPSFTRLDH